MTRNSLSLSALLTGALLVCLSIVAPATAIAQDDGFVLVAPHWGAKQTATVEAAGGTVVYGHPSSGIGLATSTAPGFLDQVMASKAFKYGAPDALVQWQPDVPSEQSITPGDETFYPFQWNLTALDAAAAWDAGCTGAGARVAILDGGIYDQHIDLDDNLDTGCSVSFVPGAAFNEDLGTFWHGTHVAGIVAAEDNGVGVLGVAPEATLMGVKVLHGGSGSFGWLIGGLLYASDPASFGLGGCAKADIINMSLGAIFPKSATGGGQLLAAVTKAVNFAASQGVLVISAAANNGLDLGQLRNYVVIPAEAGSGIAVSATGPVGFAYGATNYTHLASYTNYGENVVWVAGPGGDFTLAFQDPPDPFWFYDMVLSTSRGPDNNAFYYSWAAGTSQASPAVAGVAALIKGANPGISLGALKTRLAQTALDVGPVGHDQFYGHGFANAYRACTQ